MLLSENNLAGKILIASPNLNQNSYFARTVIYMLRNSGEGSMGLIINHPLPEMHGNVVIACNNKEIPLKLSKAYSGGPIECEKGFVLHIDKKLKLGSDPLIKLSFDCSFLKSMATNSSRARESLVVLGYCGWDCGQLEDEIIDGQWLIAPANSNIIFARENQNKWGRYLSLLNVNSSQYVDYVGHC